VFLVKKTLFRYNSIVVSQKWCIFVELSRGVKVLQHTEIRNYFYKRNVLLMKKFFTLCAALLSTAACFAQESTTFSFVRNGEVVPNGSTVVLNAPTDDMTFDFMPGMHVATFNTELYAQNNTTANATMVARVYSILHGEPEISICAGGDCVALTGVSMVEKEAVLAGRANLDLELHSAGTFMTEEDMNNYCTEARVTLYPLGDEADSTSIIVKIGKKYEDTALESVKSNNRVAINGRTLNYQFNQAEARIVRLYNISGAAVMSRRIKEASGTISLAGLPAGIYIYQISGQPELCGKIMLK
jgi:hypothetical protein